MLEYYCKIAGLIKIKNSNNHVELSTTILERVWYLSQQVECICNIAKYHNVAYDSTSTEAFTEIAVTPITTRHLIISRAAVSTLTHEFEIITMDDNAC